LIPEIFLALSPLGESDFSTPMGSIGPQKSGRVARGGAFFSPSDDGDG
jgi:hypothetical protein